MPNKPATTHDSAVWIFTQIIGVGVFALLAGINDQMGKMMVVIMTGIVIVWAMTHLYALKTIANRA